MIAETLKIDVRVLTGTQQQWAIGLLQIVVDTLSELVAVQLVAVQMIITAKHKMCATEEYGIIAHQVLGVQQHVLILETVILVKMH